MAQRHWLVKSEPGAYAWERLVREGRAVWDGIRNAQARNSLAEMARGDLVLFYHSGAAREVVGIAQVARAAYPEPGAGDARWLAVDLEPLRPLARPVALARIKAERALAGIALVTHSRLSVMPLDPAAFERILALATAAAPEAPARRRPPAAPRKAPAARRARPKRRSG
jgi:predicted RNA-binding protein with PUA-like domain